MAISYCRANSPSRLLGTGLGTNTLKLAGIFPAHHALVSRSLATLPKASALLSNDTAAAKLALVHGVILLAAAPATDHAVGPLVGVVLGFFVAAIAGKDLVAAGEAEPAVRLAVMHARTTVGQRLARVQTELLGLAFGARRRGRKRAGRNEEKLDVGDLEGKLGVALAAHIRHRFTADGDESMAGRRAASACRYKGTRQHVCNLAAREIDEASSGRMLVDVLRIVLGGKCAGTFLAAASLLGPGLDASQVIESATAVTLDGQA